MHKTARPADSSAHGMHACGSIAARARLRQQVKDCTWREGCALLVGGHHLPGPDLVKVDARLRTRAQSLSRSASSMLRRGMWQPGSLPPGGSGSSGTAGWSRRWMCRSQTGTCIILHATLHGHFPARTAISSLGHSYAWCECTGREHALLAGIGCSWKSASGAGQGLSSLVGQVHHMHHLRVALASHSRSANWTEETRIQAQHLTLLSSDGVEKRAGVMCMHLGGAGTVSSAPTHSFRPCGWRRWPTSGST